MTPDTSGRTNSQYVLWLCDTACVDCSDVEELYIQYANGDEETLRNNTDICGLMNSPSEQQVATYVEVKYSGTGPEENPWYAIDKRVTNNLERTANQGVVPIKIKVPIGS